MNAQNRASVVDIYQTDLERHLFAPSPRRNLRPRQSDYHGVSDWVRDWLLTGWTRWKHFAEAMNLT